jgi:hypothetical protein
LKTIGNKAAASAVMGLVLVGMSGWASAFAQPAASFAGHLLSRVATPLPLAYHARSGRLLVATQVPAPAARFGDGSKSLDVERVPSSPGNSILRLRVDAQRERLWVLEIGAVHVIDLVTRQRIARIELTNWMHTEVAGSCLPDLQLDPVGAAFVTDNVQPKVWRIDADAFTLREHDVPLETEQFIDAGFTALLVHGDGSMVAAMAAAGSLWRIDAGLAHAQQIALDRRIHGACALERAGASDDEIVALAAARDSLDVYRIDLPRGQRGAKVAASGAFATPVPAGLISIDGEPYLATLRSVVPEERRSRPPEAGLTLTPVRAYRTGRRPPI